MTQKKKSKPDAIVFNDEEQRYDAGLKPYATNLGAPAITTNDTAAWKNSNINKVNKQVKAKYDELKAEFDALMEKYEYNNLIYNSKFSFEPVVGETYYLYRDHTKQPFLSIISPQECNFDYIGTFKLNADKMWEKM